MLKQSYKTAAGLTGLCFALLKLGQNASMIRGSIGGITYANNRAGAYARNRSIPVNPRSPLQTAQRGSFGAQSSAWGDLTAAQQDAWNSQAPFITLVNRVGETYTPTGRQYFLGVNNQLAAVGATPLSDPPSDLVPPALPATGGITATVTAGHITALSIDYPSDTPAGSVLQVFACPVALSGRTNFQKYFRVLSIYAADASFDLLADYTAKYGSVATVGQQVALQWKLVKLANGAVSPTVTSITTLTA